MNIAVISDTHMNQPSGWFLRLYEEHLAGADVLVHCGDITGPAVYHHLLQHPNLVAVRGNCDWDPGLTDGLEEFAHREFILREFAHRDFSGPQSGLGATEGAGFALAACHGWGSRSGVPARVAQHFGPDWDLVCFGHTHARYFSDEHGVLMVNPGSLGESGSWAMLTADGLGAPTCTFHSVQL